MRNICRSPSAHGVFRHPLLTRGLERQVQVGSAGTHNRHPGQPPDRRSQRAAALRGYDISDLRERQLNDDDFAHVLDLIEDACKGLIDRLSRRLRLQNQHANGGIQ